MVKVNVVQHFLNSIKEMMGDFQCIFTRGGWETSLRHVGGLSSLIP